MGARLSDLKDELRTNFWFLPLLMAIGAVLLYFLTINLDRSDTLASQNFFWLYSGGAGDASTLLSSLAGATITVAGVTFSLMLAALTVASSQFGPRLIRNFMRDWINQVALGLFSATFIYCLLVLRTLRGDSQTPFVPHLSISIGIGLGLASILVLIFFIHHVSQSIQVASVVAEVSQDLHSSIKRLYPQRVGLEAPASQAQPDLPADFDTNAIPVRAERSGYIQVINTFELLAVAVHHDLILRLECKPGDFMVTGRTFLKVYPASRFNEGIANRLRSVFILGRQRTTVQDVESDINQLVEVAIRALSPAINDPFSAMMCIDRLGEALIKLGHTPFPSLYRYDHKGNLRVIIQAETYEQYVNAAFNQIRQYGASSVSVTIRLLDMISLISQCIDPPEHKEALYRQAVMIQRGSQKAIADEWDRDTIEEHFQQALVNFGLQPKP